MCSTAYGRQSDGEIYEVYSCGDLAEAVGCKLDEIAQLGEEMELEPTDCLCGIDVVATAERHGKGAVEDGYGDYEILGG